MQNYHAHSKNAAGRFHSLADHTRSVADIASAFAGKFGQAPLGYLAGLYHDLGKITEKFQRYLEDPKSRKGGEHKGVGAALIKNVWEPLAMVVAGHHGGLKEVTAVSKLMRDSDVQVSQEARRWLESLSVAVPAFDPSALNKVNQTELELLLRMVFSALVDADFLDTEYHLKLEKAEARAKEFSLKELWDKLEAAQSEISGKSDTPVNRARHEVYQACLERADDPQGFFRLTVPTGGGKTRSGMAFALRHALRHGLDRVIFAIPYTSIIDQTADVYREIFGDEAVLEHHSAVAWDEHEDELADGLSWARLAAENWDAPIVVTTTVQLFESLFSHMTSRCRKLHNIAGSVLVLDEVQTLPTELLDPILDGLRQLVERYRVSVVLCTATQPTFEANQIFDGLPSIREIVPDPQPLFARLKRVEYRLPEKGQELSWAEVAAIMRDRDQALTVVNTKSDALALLDELGNEDVFHLSTLLCGAHRREVLAEVRRRLAEDLPCRLVSTQVVEAGVDIDFPTVLRAVGPLDRIIQAAGRCNREGKLDSGDVIIFQPVNPGRLPGGHYRTGADVTAQFLAEPDFNPDAIETVKKYFRKLYASVNSDVHGIQNLRKRFNYPEVGTTFKLIEENTVPVVINKIEEAKTLVNELQTAHPQNARKLVRKLQPYIVNIYRSQLSKPAVASQAEELLPGLYLWLGKYHEIRGLVADATNVDAFMA